MSTSRGSVETEFTAEPSHLMLQLGEESEVVSVDESVASVLESG